MSHRRVVPLLFGVLTCLTGTGIRAEQNHGPEPALRAIVGEFEWERPAVTSTQLPGGVVVTTGPDTVVERLPNMKVRTGAQATTNTYVYRLTRGSFDVTVKPSRKNATAVLVYTPGGLSGAVSQGRGVVRVTQDTISFTAQTAPMLVAKGEHSRLLGTGRTFAIDVARGGFHEVSLPSAPALFLEQGLALSLPRTGFETTVRMKPDPNIERYELAFLKRSADEWISIATKRTTKNEALFTGNGSGDYAVVGRAFDRFGIESQTSAPLVFRAVGVKLPEGAQQVSGGFALTPRQHLEFSEVDGLIMSFGFGESFVEAPRMLSLPRGKGALVRLFDPRTQSEVRFQLVPNVVRAQIALGSPRTTWPKDRTLAVVKLVNGRGHPLKSSAGYTASVSINSEPRPVRWERSGNVMRAVITPPPHMPGPWVLRVEVKNRQEELVGRDFLEVAPSPEEPDTGWHW